MSDHDTLPHNTQLTGHTLHAPSDTPRTDALRDSFGGDCCVQANEALLLSAEFEGKLTALTDGYVLVPREPPFPRDWIAQGVRTVNGKSETFYIGWTAEAGGWYEWCAGRESAKRFKSEDEALKAARSCTGPHYNQPDPSTICATQIESREAADYRAMLAAVGE